MVRANNFVNFTGLEQYTVSPIPGRAAFTTIQEAVNAAVAAGGGSVYIAPGTYNETVTITSAVSLIGYGSGSGSSGTSITINTGVIYDTTAGSIDVQISGIAFNGSGGNPGFSIIGTNSANVVIQNCNFQGSSDTCILVSAPGQIKMSLCTINANSGVQAFNVTGATISVYDSNVNSTDTQSTMNSTGQTLFFFNCIVFDSFDVIDGQVIFFASLPGTISTLPIATVHTAGAVAFPGSLIINDTSASGFIVDGNGAGTSGVVFFFSFAQAPQIVTPIAFDPNLTILALNELPFAQGGGTATAIRGSAAFDSSSFSVSSSGFVSLSGTPPTQWIDATVSQNIVPNQGYSVSANAVVLTLPTTAAQFTGFKVALNGGTSWQIAQNIGQSILFGSVSTTVGSGGSITSTRQGDTLSLICDIANTHWFVESGVGNLGIG